MAGEFLRVVRGATEGADVRVDDEVVLGREVDGAGYLGESAEVSRRHARLTRAPDGGLLVEDLGSLNGTLVNGERIERARRLGCGDTVKVGDALLVVVDAQGRAGQPTAYASGTSIAPEPTIPGGAAPEPSPRSSAWTDLGDLQLVTIAVVLLAIAFAVFLLLR